MRLISWIYKLNSYVLKKMKNNKVNRKNKIEINARTSTHSVVNIDTLYPMFVVVINAVVVGGDVRGSK